MKIKITGLDKLRKAMLTDDRFAFLRRRCPDCEQVYLNGDNHKCPVIIDAVFSVPVLPSSVGENDIFLLIDNEGNAHDL